MSAALQPQQEVNQLTARDIQPSDAVSLAFNRFVVKAKPNHEEIEETKLEIEEIEADFDRFKDGPDCMYIRRLYNIARCTQHGLENDALRYAYDLTMVEKQVKSLIFGQGMYKMIFGLAKASIKIGLMAGAAALVLYYLKQVGVALESSAKQTDLTLPTIGIAIAAAILGSPVEMFTYLRKTNKVKDLHRSMISEVNKNRQHRIQEVFDEVQRKLLKHESC